MTNPTDLSNPIDLSNYSLFFTSSNTCLVGRPRDFSEEQLDLMKSKFAINPTLLERIRDRYGLLGLSSIEILGEIFTELNNKNKELENRIKVLEEKVLKEE